MSVSKKVITFTLLGFFLLWSGCGEKQGPNKQENQQEHSKTEKSTEVVQETIESHCCKEWPNTESEEEKQQKEEMDATVEFRKESEPSKDKANIESGPVESDREDPSPSKNPNRWLQSASTFAHKGLNLIHRGRLLKSGLFTVRDSKGHQFLVGNFSGKISFASKILEGKRAFFVARLDSQGKVLWSNVFDGHPNKSKDEGSYVTSIHVDNQGKLHVLGYFHKQMRVGTKVLQTTSPVSGLFALKFDTLGKLLWAVSPMEVSEAPKTTSPSPHTFNSAIDSQGNSYLIGGFNGSITWQNEIYRSRGKNHYFLLLLDSSGKLSWVKTFGSDNTINQYAFLGIDGKDHIYVAGTFGPSMTIGQKKLQATKRSDIFLVKLSGKGDLLWSRTYHSDSSSHFLGSLAVANDGSVYFSAIVAKMTFGSSTIEPKTGTCGAVFHVDANGTSVWAKDFCQSYSGRIFLWQLAVSPENEVYASGGYQRLVHVGGQFWEGGQSFLLKLGKQGSLIWAKSMQDIEVHSIQAPKKGKIDVFGTFVKQASLGKSSFASDGRIAALLLQLNDLPTTDACLSHQDCPLAHRCTQGVCLQPSSQCSASAPYCSKTSSIAEFCGEVNGITTTIKERSCGSQENCFSGRCVTSCKSSSDCNKGYFCYHSSCVKETYELVRNKSSDVVQVANTSGLVVTKDHVFTVGTFSGTAQFGKTKLTSKGNWNLFVTKQQKQGIFQWSKSFGGKGNITPKQILHDGSDGLYILASYFGELEIETKVSPTEAKNGVVLFKVDMDGKLQWVQFFDLGSSCSVNHRLFMETKKDTVLLSGQFCKQLELGTTILKEPGSLRKTSFVARFDGQGKLHWAKTFGQQDNHLIQSMKIGVQGELFLVGTFSGTLKLGSTTLQSSGSTDGFFAKMTVDGKPVWAKQLEASGGKIAINSFQLSTTQGLFLLGNFTGSFEVGTKMYDIAQGDRSLFLVKWDTSGKVIWFKSMKSTKKVYGDVLRVTSKGDLLFSGVYGHRLSFGSKQIASSSSSHNSFLTSIDAQGKLQWFQSVADTDRKFELDSDGKQFFVLNSKGWFLFSSNPTP